MKDQVTHCARDWGLAGSTPALSCDDFGQVVNTQSSIIWYWPKGVILLPYKYVRQHLMALYCKAHAFFVDDF